ncbi:S8 family serine peptidase [Paractinoplanes hotanensis]|uniref:S8 family serine peptidase n=1 Tax=Paractinoplanes hotanensis TaxID=2906497 RepID=A0ABT0YFW3_9ACTN|nr:S8 family serine peptidase [Actinoplanes hotanensis]MCM4084941.1 S8 family serine peptidase [Actinoplanes hotanensis]
MSWRRTAVRSVALVAIAGLVPTSAAAASAAAKPMPGQLAGASPTGRPHTVTLVTGDRVTIAKADSTTARIEPAAGREHISFATTVVRGHLHVMPGDAAAMLRTQQLDRRLFDVTELVSLGYDDAARPTVPMIVRYRSTATAARTKRAIAAAGGQLGRDLPAVRGLAVNARKTQATTLWEALNGEQRADVQHVWLDGIRKRLLDVSVPQIGAPAAWQAGYTGKGMAVAVLDGGVDEAHPDLVGKVTSQNFTAEPTAADTDGHGTHVASTIAGTGAASGGKYKGVAPEATILNGKVCELYGCPDSAILAGMQWAAVDRKARVINMSLGGDDLPGIDPLEEAANSLSEQTGALFVLAAGNSGADETIGTPGSADAALTVGAVDKSDRTADFSSRGPRSFDGSIKPDIAGPGVDIVAARASGSTIGQPAADFPDTYQSLNGTSMATPHVAGAAALLAQQHPDWNGARLKSVLMASAKPDAAAGPFEQGAGRVDLTRAITQTLTSEPGSVSFGLLHWPHDSDTALTKTVTYRNAGTADVTVDLALTGETTTVFRLSETRLSVPAGGSANVTVTADTTGAVAPGAYTGRIVATAGPAQVSTPIAIQKEDERYALTLRNIGLHGKLTPNNLTQIYQPVGDYFALPWDPSGEVTIRVPKGRYTVGSYIDTSAAGDGSQQTTMFQPFIDIAGDTTVTFDARKAARVSQAVPEPSAAATSASIGIAMTVDGGSVSYGTTVADFSEMRIGLADPTAPGLPAMTGFVSSGWAQKDSGPRGVNSPYAYYAAEYVPGTTLVSGGYRRAFTAHELATETQTLRSYAGGQTAQQAAIMFDRTGNETGAAVVRAKASTPRTNYHTTGPGVRWALETQIGTADEEGFIVGPVWRSAARTYRAGSNGSQEWGAAPYGLAFNSYTTWISRRRGDIVAAIPQVGDAAGHVGFDRAQTTSSKFYRDGELLGDYDGNTTGAFDLPDAESEYRVEQTMTGVGYAGLATEKTVAFTFRSARSATDDPVALPVFAVRYQPSLDASNSVRGRVGDLPLWVQNQAGERISVRTLGAEVSFDDGKTWRALRVPPSGVARVTYPKGKGFVSVRLNAAHDNGSSVTQTVLRAYRYSGNG